MKEDDVIICRCEEITESEIVEAIRQGARDVDAVKRMTRAGMGMCQGRTCSLLIRRILCRELGLQGKNLPPVTTRPPVRLVPSKAFRVAENGEE